MTSKRTMNTGTPGTGDGYRGGYYSHFPKWVSFLTASGEHQPEQSKKSNRVPKQAKHRKEDQ
jgi:hypothetical protein